MSKKSKNDKLEAALWELYNKAPDMDQDKFNRCYKVIESMIELARITKEQTGFEQPEFFTKGEDQ